MPQKQGLTAEEAKTNVDHVFGYFKRYLALNGGNISSKFRDLDTDGDNNIQREELTKALYKYSPDLIDEKYTESIFFLYDTNKTGAIPYNEFCSKFYEYANSKKVKDTSDF